MKSENLNNQKTEKQCLITFNWLILLTIIISFGISGCVPNMNSNKKSGKNQSQLSNVSRSKSKKEREKQNQINSAENQTSADNTQLNAILEFDKKISNSSYHKASNKKKNIISEDDKYEELKQKQQNMEEEFTESIANVKEELLEIKRILSDVASDKIIPSAARSNYDNMIHPKESATIKNDENNILDKTFIIQSEEAKSNIKEQNINKNLKTQKQITPKVNKNFKVIKTKTPKQEQEQVNNITKSQNTDVTNTQNTDTVSSNNSTENNFSDIISKLAKGDYNSASKIANDKLNRSKDPVVISNCNYWLGEISFNQHDYAKSIAYFNAALNSNCDKKDIAQSRIAESYLRVGKNDKAKIAYQNLLKEYPKSTHSPKAKKMLQQL